MYAMLPCFDSCACTTCLPVTFQGRLKHAWDACTLLLCLACSKPACQGMAGQPLKLQVFVQVVGVKSREILLNAGNIHCITQQCPAAQ